MCHVLRVAWIDCMNFARSIICISITNYATCITHIRFALPRTVATQDAKAKIDLTRVQRISILDQGTKMAMGRPNVTTAIWTGSTSQYENK